MKLVVTGASTGIGHALALRAAGAGWDVLVSLRDERARARLEAAGCVCARLELRDEDSLQAFAEQVQAWCDGRLQALVNNAGTALPGALEETPLAELREQFEVNVFGPLRLTQLLLPAVRAGSGHVIFVGSERARDAAPLYGAYGGAKLAIEGFAAALDLELRELGARASVVRLGPHESRIRVAIRARLERLARLASPYAGLAREMLARLGRPPLLAPDEAARAVLALLREPDPEISAAPRTRD